MIAWEPVLVTVSFKKLPNAPGVPETFTWLCCSPPAVVQVGETSAPMPDTVRVPSPTYAMS